MARPLEMPDGSDREAARRKPAGGAVRALAGRDRDTGAGPSVGAAGRRDRLDGAGGARTGDSTKEAEERGGAAAAAAGVDGRGDFPFAATDAVPGGRGPDSALRAG